MTFHPTGPTIGNLVPPLTIANGGTGQTTATSALSALGGQPLTDSWWGPTDQGLLAWNYDPAGTPSGGSNVLATGGTMYTHAIRIPAALPTVTNIVTILITNGSVLTSGQCFAALYQGAGGTLIGRTADQATAWGAGATKVVTMALNGGPFPVSAGVVYVGMWFNGTTGPAFLRTTNTSAIGNIALADAASRWGTANTGLTNAASTPGTLGTITATGFVAAYWVGLS